MKIKNQSDVVEQHLIQHWMYFQHTEQSVKVDTSEIKWISARPYNRGVYAGTRHIEPALEICSLEGEEPLWIVGPSSDVNLGAVLRKNGFVPYEKWIGMIQFIQEKKYINGGVEGFQCKRVHTEEDLTQWIKVYIDGYQKPKENQPDFLSRFKELMQHADQYQLYLGLYHNQPAVAGSLFFHKGTAGLYCITTARHMRRKGLATEYLKEVLTVAKKQAHTCILHATSAGKPAYEKLGFIAVNEFDVYGWRNRGGKENTSCCSL
ncbi:GNAT family N-acetyltransferase [Priestia aryabhattai]|uniref:GNAT family N-acetyltransferase n=1 Tax=Priestia megaterium TaxID=1404 RepID=UPI0039B97B6C